MAELAQSSQKATRSVQKRTQEFVKPTDKLFIEGKAAQALVQRSLKPYYALAKKAINRA